MAIPQPPLQRRGADISPALVQALRGLLDGVILSIAVAGILIVQKHVTQGEHRRHPFSVLLDVTLQVLNTCMQMLKSFLSIYQTDER